MGDTETVSTPRASKTLTYDALLRPVRIEVKNQQAHLLAQRLYQYDATGNISQIESDLGVTDYGYDKLDRLIQANPSTALQALNLPQEQYSYDPVGNRTVSAHQPGNWTYSADNQLTQYPSLKPFSLGASPVETQVSYSPQGHTQQETNAQGTKDYRYNAAERLIGFTNTLQGQSEPSIEAHYRYDPFGRRISKTVTQNASSNSSTTWFIYSEQGLIAEANEQGELTKAYGFNPVAAQQGLWSTDPIWQANVADNQLNSTETTYHYLHTDHLYTPILATNKEGSITWKAVQEAFGALNTLNQSRISMNLRFPGQYYDVETGTHYNFHRDYRPNAGRYVQSDPIGLGGGVNMYSYVDSGPVSQIDPTGLVRWSAQTIGGARGFLYAFTGGAEVMRFSSTCQNGNSCVVYTAVVVVGVGIGTPIGITMDIRGTTYIDGFSEPSPSSIGGVAVKQGCQAVIGRGVVSGMLIVVGNTVNESKFSFPNINTVGFDISCQASVGISVVLYSDCDCGDDCT